MLIQKSRNVIKTTANAHNIVHVRCIHHKVMSLNGAGSLVAFFAVLVILCGATGGKVISRRRQAIQPSCSAVLELVDTEFES